MGKIESYSRALVAWWLLHLSRQESLTWVWVGPLLRAVTFLSSSYRTTQSNRAKQQTQNFFSILPVIINKLYKIHRKKLLPYFLFHFIHMCRERSFIYVFHDSAKILNLVLFRDAFHSRFSNSRSPGRTAWSPKLLCSAVYKELVLLHV